MSKKIDRQNQWYCVHSLVDQSEATGTINSQCIWGKQKGEGGVCGFAICSSKCDPTGRTLFPL